MIMENLVFSCVKCGSCCDGEGGIVVSPSDLLRLCTYLNLDNKDFIEHYGILHNNKLKIRTADDGYCIFFVKDKGCSVHSAKPNICKAWPYFRGNMIDAESFSMAKQFCSGISSTVSHEDFVAEGKKYLNKEGLVATDPNSEANALIG